jgi:hypothetical protein
MHGVHVACSAMAPTAVANGGVACGTQLLWHLILRWVASDFGSKACGRKRQGKKQGIKKQNLSSPVACPGEGEGETVPSKNGTVLFLFFFFFGKCMKRRRFFQNASFHLNGNWRQSARFHVSPSICALFNFGPWFWISSIKSLIGHQTSIFMQLSPRFDQINSKKL